MPDQTPSLPVRPSVFLTVWDEAWASLSKPGAYPAWAKQPLRRSVAYLALICTVAAVASTIYLVMMGGPRLAAAQQWLVQNVPAVDITNGTLHVAGDKPFTYTDDRNIYVKVDDTQALKDVHIDNFYTEGAYFAKDGLLIRTGDQTDSETYSDAGLDGLSVTGQSVATNLATLAHVGLVAAPFVLLALSLIGNLAYAWLFAFVGYLFSGMKIPLRHLWNMGIYALTPSLLASYILFVIHPIDIVPSLVFVVYYTLAVTQYRRLNPVL